MNRVVGYFVRFAVIIFGYVVACLAASAFGHVLFLGLELAGDLARPLVISIPITALVIAYLAFLPAMIVILATEFLGRRDWLTFSIAGALVAGAVAIRFWRSTEAVAALPDSARIIPDSQLGLILIGGGVVGGLAYWVAAGRWAGWQKVPTSPGPSGS